MNDLNLKDLGLTELSSEEMQNTNGGFIPPKPNLLQPSDKKKEKEDKERLIENQNH